MSDTHPTRTPAFEARLRKRYAAERRFKALGLGAILFSIAVLLFLLVTMTWNGIGGFSRTEVAVPVDFGKAALMLDPALGTDAAKLFCSTAAKEIADNAIQVLGGYGYCSEYRVEQFWRDAKLIEIGGGTLEAHQKNITRDLTRS